MTRLILHAAAAFSLLSLPALAAGSLPAPVSGVSVEEWTAGNARLSDNQPLKSVLDTLEIGEVEWNKADETFTQALRDGDPDSELFRRYGEVFAQPAVGRFARKDGQPRIQGKLATFEDYASVQAHLEVAAEAGRDPQEVLKEHGLTVYEYSRETRPWVEEMARAAGGKGGFERMTLIRDRFHAQYRLRYGLAENKDE